MAAKNTVLVAGFALSLAFASEGIAQGVLSVEVQSGYNLVVDSNITAPSTYGPKSAFISARVCNTGNAAVTNAFAQVGNYNGGVGDTPAIFPAFDSTGDPRPFLANTGSYSLTLESGSAGAADATRYIGTLNPGECRIQYWLISYPQCVNSSGQPDAAPCTTSITGGIGPEDDLTLDYDVWATGSVATASVTRSFTMRNEISAAANKIWPNNTSKVPDAYLAAIESVVGWGTLGPDGQPLTQASPIFPGQRVITTQGIWYDLGNVGQGFDNDGDLIPDQNGWLQPVGDPAAFDAGCFRMVNVYGVVIVKLKTGGELLIPFQNRLYFEHIPENTGVVGLVYYQFIATDSGCSASMTPYQEAASGFDNEKFSADYGLSLGLESGGFDGTDLQFTKTDGLTSASTGGTLSYEFTANNASTGVNLGAPDLGVPIVFRDSIPAGTTFVAGSADDSPNTNLTEPSGIGSFNQGYTDIDGNLDTCAINYSITSSSYVVLYSNDNGVTWSTTEPAGVTDLQWILLTTIALDGSHNGTACVAPNGTFDDGTLETSLPSGKSTTLRFQVTVNATGGPVVCNRATLGFGGVGSGTFADDCTLITGNNSISGTVFEDDGGTTGVFGNGTLDGNEGTIGPGVVVTLYYDANGDGLWDSGDLLYATTSTNGSGAYSFSGVPDGPFLVVAKKYDGAVSNGVDDAATDAVYGTTGWGNTTFDPNLPLTTDTGVLKMNEDSTLVTLAVNLDLDKNNGTAQSLTGVSFGFAPPFRLTKTVTNNPDINADGVADIPIDEGDVFTYTLRMENRLPSVGVQGPTGCQYTVWAPTGATSAQSSKNFTNPTYAWDATSPNGVTATALVDGGGLRLIYGTGFSLADQPGNITKVEGLYFGYFGAVLTDDTLNVIARIGAASGTFTFSTAMIDSFVGAPADFNPNNAVAWDITSSKPGGGTWSWADNFAALELEINPSKAANADQKTFYLDAIGIRVSTDVACVASSSSTLSPVPLQDTYDPNRFTFISATPPPSSVNTATGVITWNDLGPILPGTSASVTVTYRAKDITGSVTGNCGVTPDACNSATTSFGANHVYYADGRLANDDSDSIAVSIVGKGELRGSVWSDTNNDGWADNDGEPRLPGVGLTLYGCVRADGVTLETASSNSKDCIAMTNGNFWKAMSTATTDAAGAYEFIGLDSGYYLIEIGDTDGSPTGGNTSPYGKTQTAEPNDAQDSTAGSANGHTCPTCNNIWGSSAALLRADQTTINFLNGAGEETVDGVNFGYFSSSAVAFGNIFNDVDGDAVEDPGELGSAGFTVGIYTDPNSDGNPADGVLVASTTSDANGNYVFSGLSAGSYVIVVTPPLLLHKTWTETVESTGGTASLNDQIPVTLSAGQVSGSHDFGYTQADTSDIGDTLYIDFDGDGIQDASEAGIPNVTVWLYEDVDRNGIIDPGVDALLLTDVTDASGNYLFVDMSSGSYVVKVDVSDPDFPTDVSATGDPDLTASSIGDYIWFDADGAGDQDVTEDGIPGVVVQLYRDVDLDGVLDGGEPLVAATTTDVTGRYLFTGLPAGQYFVDIDSATLPSSALVLTTADPVLTPIVLATSSSSVLTGDAGYSPSSGFALGNRVWHDFDGDNVQDAGEVGIGGIGITVTGTGCAPCTATTDADGFWIVTGLSNGTYSVDVTNADLPRDFVLTAGTDPRNATIASADLMNVDFGYRYTTPASTPTGTITGRVFLDGDADLTYDVGEARSGTTVNLLDETGAIVATTVTAADGTYAFNGVFIGEYTVESRDPLGTRYSTVFLSAAQAFPNLNVIYNASIETTADNQASIAVDGIHDSLNADFGYLRFLGSVGDTVYQDINENGTQDLGEPGIDGVTVTLYTANWTDSDGDAVVDASEITNQTLLATTTTSADDPLTAADEGGKYLFANLDGLPDGTFYIVEVDTATMPLGTTATLIADPDTDGVPCTQLPDPDVVDDEFPPPSVCDSEQLIRGFLTGDNYLGGDFGYRLDGSGFAAIGDHLWIDTDNDGVVDFGEPGVAGITVWLDLDNDSVIDAGETVESDSDGYYVFPNIPDGTYTLTVQTGDSDWPAGLPTTPTYEAGTASFDNTVSVTVTAGAVSSIGGNACSSCDLEVDFGYRYGGVNSLSGTACIDESGTPNGYCGATATTYTGVSPSESPLGGIQVGLYFWVDDGDNTAWSGSTIDAGDTFTFLGSVTTNSGGDYSFSNVPDDIVVVFSVPDSQNLRLTTTNGNTSVEDANVVSRQLYDGTTTYLGNTVTVIGRQALNVGPDGDNIIQDLDYAFDGTLGGAIANDFGDLPSVFSNTLLVDAGAQHRVTASSIYLGSGVSSESNGLESATASADSNDDGVVTPGTLDFPLGGTAEVTVTASAAGWLGGWIDFNHDGDFDDADENFIDQAVASGANQVSFNIPNSLPTGTAVEFFTRFRIYPSRPTLLSSTGAALDATFQVMAGEVEDHRWSANVTPAIISSFSARAIGNSVAVEWTTASEVGTVGFFLLRWKHDTSEWVPVNDEMLPAIIANPLGGSYRYFDDDAVPGGGYHYTLLEIESNGRNNRFGPFFVNTDAADSGTDEQMQELAVERLVADPGIFGYSKVAHADLMEGRGRPGEMVAGTESLTAHAAGKDPVVGAKIAVAETGMQYVSLTDIETMAGFRIDKTWLSSNKNLYAFTNRGGTVAFTAAPDLSGIYFYGQASESIFASDNVYWIGDSTRNSPRMKVRKEGSVFPPSGAETFDRTVHVEQDRISTMFTDFFSDPETSFWTWDYLVAGQSGKSFSFRTDGIAPGIGDAVLTIRLMGATSTPAAIDHHASIKLNGRYVGEAMWDGMTRKQLTLTLDAGDFVDGENTLEIEALRDTGAPYGVMHLDSFDVNYRSRYKARGNRLQFSADGNQSILVNGFTRPDVMVYDITNPGAPVLIEAPSVSTANGFGVAISPSAPANVYLALTPDAVVHANRIKPDSPSTLAKSSNSAEYLVITTRELKDTAKRLADYRSDLTSMVVDIEDVWDEFNYGVASPHALRSFLTYAQKNWVKAPRYVVLAGDGSFDYKDVYARGGNLVPPMTVNTPFGLVSSDNWAANTDTATAAPEIAIGRLPALNSTELGAMIDKIQARERASGGAWMKRTLILADNADVAGSFPFDSDGIASLAPQGNPLDKIYLSNLSVGAARARIVAGLNQGAGLVSYVGHGGLDRLASEGMFTNTELNLLSNADAPTILTAMTCHIGIFSYPGYATLGELMILKPGTGAAAVWAPSGFSQNEHAVALGRAFYATAFANGNPRIGDVILSAMKLYEAERRPAYILDIYTLLGDPAMRLR